MISYFFFISFFCDAKIQICLESKIDAVSQKMHADLEHIAVLFIPNLIDLAVWWDNGGCALLPCWPHLQVRPLKYYRVLSF